MKNLKTRKNRKGFTLVELIVVIAILAILAGVAIPVYSGYIKKANDAKVLTQLDAVKTAAAAACAESATTVDSITVSSAGAVTVTPVSTEEGVSAAVQTAFAKYYTGSVPDMSNTSYANGVTWSDGAWTPTA